MEQPETGSRWKRKLLIFVSAFLFFETLTGLSIYLLPFSVSNQVMVLLHTIIGLLFIIPYGIYQYQHWQLYRERSMNDIKLTGYISMGATVVAIISGLILTYQAIFTVEIGYFWKQLHLLSTFIIIATILTHIGLMVYRDLKARHHEQIEDRVSAQKHYGLNTLFLVLAQFTLIALFIYAYRPPELNNKLPEDYHYAYGQDRPFAPSLAKTSTGDAIDSRLLGGSESCTSSGCHEQIGREWETSAHRYSAMDPAFRAVQASMGKQKGPESTRYCGGCHDPISLFSGTKNLYSDKLTNKTGLDEGVSCISCHSITKADVKGNAEYVIDQPERYIFELQDNALAKSISDFLIRAYPKKHIETYQRPLFKTPEFCASCHKQFIDENINNVGWVQLQNQFDNWRKSRWNHPREPMKTIECRECHMPLVDSFDPASGDPLDYNRSSDDGKHRSHRFLGANQFVPKLLGLPGAEEHVDLVEKWLQGKIEIPEIEDKWTSGPSVPIKLIMEDTVRIGDKVDIGVTFRNNKVGHNFPTGPLDIIQSWLQIVVTDKNGNTLFTTGTLDENNFIEPGSFIFKAEPVDEYNNIIDRHNLWEMVGVRYSRALFPGYSDHTRYSFTLNDITERSATDLPGSGPAPSYSHDPITELRVVAKLNYRKMNQYLMNAMFEGILENPTAPVTTLSTDQKIVTVIR